MIKNGQWITEFKKNQLVEPDVVGAGCLLIQRNVLEQLPPQRVDKPWFNWTVDARGKGILPDHECLSEDFTFCIHARKHGFKVKVDTSVKCRHIGYAEADFLSYQPLNTISA
jgi:hypothetical protein